MIKLSNKRSYINERVLFAILFFTYGVNAQNDLQNYNKTRLGANYGFGTQESFPFNSKDYSYDIRFYKIQINYKLKENRKWSFELNVEPSYYLAEHQLLNKYYVKPEDGDDYLEKREEFIQKKNINEYVLNLGIIARYKIYKSFSTYAIGSVGPMYSDTDTERMNAGFAFSDIFGLGVSYKINRFYLDFRYSFRHVSNLNINLPNNGYNSSNIEIGCTYQL
ncbi:MAG: acyloxyacyl hydrolase [Flavobacteriaceae bacterium]|nr:acyloxyacyl hydrolase [Flavobacteriaceae bacterium]